MSVFRYLWDQDARLLLVFVDSPAPVEFVRVIRRAAASGRMETIGVATPSRAQTEGLFAVRLPDADEEYPLQLLVQGYSTADGRLSATELSDRVTLDPTATPYDSEAFNWYIHDDAQIRVAHASETVPDDVLSPVWIGRRSGEVVSPGTTGSGVGQGGQFRVNLRQDLSETGLGYALTITPQGDPRQCPRTVFRAFSLSAGRTVAGMLGSAGGVVARRENLSEASWPEAHGGRETAQVLHVPQKTEDGSEGEDPHAGVPLGYLDRIVLQSSPPATFCLALEDGPLEMAGHDGVMVVAVGMDGAPYVDAGELVKRFAPSERGSSVDTREADRLVAAYADCGIALNGHDLSQGSWISAALYVETRERIRDSYGALSDLLIPHDYSHFRQTPSLFGVLAGTDPDRFAYDLPNALQGALSTHGTSEALLLSAVAQTAARRERDDPSRGAALRRAALWIEQDDQEPSGWLKAACMHVEPFRKAIGMGLDPRTSDIGTLCLVVQRGDREIEDYARTLDLLTNAGAVPLELDEQFVALDSVRTRASQLHDRLAELQHFIEDVNLAVKVLPRDFTADTSFVASLAHLPANERARPGARRGFERNALQLVLDRIRQATERHSARDDVVFGDGLLVRLADKFMLEMRDDCLRIADLVKKGLPDPASATAKPGPGLNEASFFDHRAGRQDITEDDRRWLIEFRSHSPLVNEWKRELRRSLETPHAGSA